MAAAERLDGFAGRCRLDPTASLVVQARLRRAFLLTADYIAGRGRILLVPRGFVGASARWGTHWPTDPRSDASVGESFTGSYFRKPGLSADRAPDKAVVAVAMMRGGINAEGERDSDAEHDAAAYFNIPGAVDINAPDPDDDVDDDPLAGLTITDDGDFPS